MKTRFADLIFEIVAAAGQHDRFAQRGPHVSLRIENPPYLPLSIEAWDSPIAGENRRISVAHYFELPGVTHFAWDFAYRDASLFRRVEAIRRNPYPERVVFSTFTPRYNKLRTTASLNKGRRESSAAVCWRIAFGSTE